MANAVEMSTMRKLVAQLNQYRHEYYNLNAPSVADDVYDYIQTLIETTNDYVDQICFENLNLRGAAKGKILDYIAEKYPQHLDGYKAIYRKGDLSYWEQFEAKIEALSKDYTIPFVNYFYHAKIRKGGNKHD